MSDFTKEELLEWLEYQEKEIMRPLKLSGRPIDEYHLKQQKIITQLRKIVEGHFKYKYLDNDPECYHVADQEQGVDEELRELRITIDAMEVMSLDHVKTKVVHEHKQKWLERIPKDCAKIKQLLRGEKNDPLSLPRTP